MPELPEVETMRRGILPIVGSQIQAVVRPPCPCKPLTFHPNWKTVQRKLTGRTILAVERIGKRAILVCDADLRLVIEPRMTGLLLLADPPDREHLRLQLDLTGGTVRELLFWDRRGLGQVKLLTAEQLSQELGPHRLGPDALRITREELQTRLRGSKREIKVALLDQAAVAGIGNLYAAEILHRSAIHPARRCDQLRRAEWDLLHQTIGEVLAEAILYEGSTLSDGTYRNVLNQDGGYQNHHRVYDRAGNPCGVCATTVVRIVQAQRATFFCPTCQPRRPRANHRIT